MASGRGNRSVNDIDEAFLLQSIKEQGEESAEMIRPEPEAGETPETPRLPEPAPEKPKEVKEQKRKRSMNYTTQFLQRNEFKGRQCVYVSQRIHSTVLEIVKILSDNHVTVGGYIDTILNAHFEVHKDEITELYNSELLKKGEKSLLE